MKWGIIRSCSRESRQVSSSIIKPASHALVSRSKLKTIFAGISRTGQVSASTTSPTEVLSGLIQRDSPWHICPRLVLRRIDATGSGCFSWRALARLRLLSTYQFRLGDNPADKLFERVFDTDRGLCGRFEEDGIHACRKVLPFGVGYLS